MEEVKTEQTCATHLYIGSYFNCADEADFGTVK